MALPNVRHFALYLHNAAGALVKAATINEIDIKEPTGRKPMFGAEGYLCHSIGAAMSKVDLKGPTPVKGSDITALTARIRNQQSVRLACIVGGKMRDYADMAVLEVGFNSKSETGEATDSISLEGGPCNLVA
jgi:hypothetical protein